MYNALRRDIAYFLQPDDTKLLVGQPDPRNLLVRALAALGGPVQDARPAPEQIRDVPPPEPRRELPEPEPLPTGPRPDHIISYHGLELFMNVAPKAGVWVRQPYSGVCDVDRCLTTNHDNPGGPLNHHGPYHFCNDHFGALMDNIAKETGQQVMDARPQLMERLASGPEDIGAGILGPSTCVSIDGIGIKEDK
jgi:hypothetical protein